MRVGFKIDVDIDTGEYEVTVQNLTNPGEAMDGEMLLDAVRKILEDLSGSVTLNPEGDSGLN